MSKINFTSERVTSLEAAPQKTQTLPYTGTQNLQDWDFA